ncbi:NUDIX domain-containing protein [Ideonella sp. A 288]|uniref:NUDIX hydrolase n=1 Tax=Ideonella sp. A 288 TaxID=1962181 RepID=UPI000B4AABD0|nr:NUDIX domain-containing protein [Ideonella sp. A 288]
MTSQEAPPKRQAPLAVAAVTPRPAATTLILRDGAPGLEVLMVRRSLQASFMPGAYVFPGGAVDAVDGSPVHAAACDEPAEALRRRIGEVTQVGEQALAYAVAALRECFEECGLWLGAPEHHLPADGDWAPLRARLHAGESLAALAGSAGLPLATSALQPWSHWVTPIGLPKRFDTLFFVVLAPAGQVPEVDAGETTTLAWVHPPAALAAHGRGDFPMEFATVRTVDSLQPFANAGVQALLSHAAAQRALPPLHPRLRLDADGRIRGVLLPGQPGYDEAA